MNAANQSASLPVTIDNENSIGIEISRTPNRSFVWKIICAMQYVLPYPRKIINYLGLRCSLIIVRFHHHFYPVKLAMEVTGRCNLCCPLCPRTEAANIPQGDMKFDDFKRVVDKLSPYLFAIRLHNYGEPMLHPQLPEMVQYAHQKRVYTNFHTNGHYLNEKNILALFRAGLDEINIAVDGMSQNSYSFYRIGGDFQKVLDGVVLLCNLKKEYKVKKPRVNLQFLAMSHNEAEIPEIISFAASVGVDRLYLKPVNINKGKDAGNSSYLPKDSTFANSEKNSNKNQKCRRTSIETIVNWDGSISICTSEYSTKKMVSRNVFTEKIEDVLFGDEYVSIRKKSYNKELSICSCCVDNDCPV